jgi:hypothetical protein
MGYGGEGVSYPMAGKYNCANNMLNLYLIPFQWANWMLYKMYERKTLRLTLVPFATGAVVTLRSLRFPLLTKYWKLSTTPFRMKSSELGLLPYLG